MIELTNWFWIGMLGMTAGTAAFAWTGLAADEEYRQYYVVLVGISGIAAVAYATMAMEIGWVTVDGRTIFTPRYIDWILTTPLLLIFLGMLVGLERQEYALVIGLNTVVMVLGFGGSLLTGVERFGLFGLASIAYVGLLYLLLGPVTERANEQADAITSVFTSLRNLTVVLWSIYPIIWLLGPSGVAVLTPSVDVMLVMYLDLVTKVGFGLIALNASATIESERGVVVTGAEGTTI
ncbi:bacteriorhodopsin [Halobacteria archaeon AArc-dxtr1]|nr:bacteriorhodopsin [Halobacteria archaeon AArc-dxtr1]